MATTFTKIATVTVGSGGAATIEFTSIPSTYTDLCILMSARTLGAQGNGRALCYQLNSSTSNYTEVNLYGDGSTTGSFSATTLATQGSTYGRMGNTVLCNPTQTANTFSNISIYIPNYTSSNYKSLSFDGVSETNATAVDTGLSALLWSNTSAITSIKFAAYSSYDFVQYTTAVLYGIKNS